MTSQHPGMPGQPFHLGTHKSILPTLLPWPRTIQGSTRAKQPRAEESLVIFYANQHKLLVTDFSIEGKKEKP